MVIVFWEGHAEPRPAQECQSVHTLYRLSYRGPQINKDIVGTLCHTVKVDNSSIERVEEFKYLGTTLTNQNSIQEEQIEVRECLLPLSAEPFVFQFAIQKFEDQDI